MSALASGYNDLPPMWAWDVFGFVLHGALWSAATLTIFLIALMVRRLLARR